jgi:hypothetical protein
MATITTIESTDTIADSRTDINTNFTNLNSDKTELVATTTDNAVVRASGTAGVQQDSSVLISDADAITGVTSLTVDNILIDGNTISQTVTDTDLVLTPNGTGDLTTAALQTVLASGASATAGGAEAVRIGTGSLGVVGIWFGSGAPTVTAPKGSLYLRTDGSSTSTRMYVNTDAGTTWTNVTTAA